MNTFCSSHYSEKTKLIISANQLLIKELPSNKAFNEIMIYISDSKENEYGTKFIKRTSLRYESYKFPILPNGNYYLNIYRMAIVEENMYYSFFHGPDIPIICISGKYFFMESPVFHQNYQFVENIKINKCDLQLYTEPSCAIQSYDAEIKKKTKEITRLSHDDYHKVLAVHNWIARSLYYDYDSLENNTYKSARIGAVNTLSSGKSVCQGYAMLSIAMLRAIGIPSVGVNCHTFEKKIESGWNNLTSQFGDSNHIFAMAYVDRRWILMDSTWDSSNQYKNGEFIKANENGIFTKYFDMTLLFISNTHRFCKILI